MESIGPSTALVKSRVQISEILDGEAVILNEESGEYFGLDEVGTFVWNLIECPMSFLALQERLMDAFEVESERCGRDLKQLLESLLARGLVEVREASHGRPRRDFSP